MKILIVEDNLLNLRLFTDLLCAYKHEVITREDGKNFINVVKKENPDLILMDIVIPSYCGIELMQELKANEELKHHKIIALTANVMKGDEDSYISKGFDGYISKPIFVVDFIKYVEGINSLKE